MEKTRLSVSIDSSVADLYRRRCRRYGFHSAAAMMSSALVLVARALSNPTVDEWEDWGREIAAEFDAHANAEDVDWGKGYKRKHNRQ